MVKEIEKVSRKGFWERKLFILIEAGCGRRKLTKMPILEIDEKIRGCEWIRGSLERNISLIGMLKSKDELAEMMSLRGSQSGIKHLDSGYSLSAEIMKFNIWMKESSPDIKKDPESFSNCLCYLSLLLFSLSIDFHEIGTSACSHGNPGWHYFILDPDLIEYYRAENKEEIEEIAARSEQIFYEVHDWAQNPECIMEDLHSYGDKLRKIADNMWRSGLLTLSQKEAVWDSLHGRIGETAYCLFGRDKEELEELLEEVRRQLELTGLG